MRVTNETSSFHPLHSSVVHLQMFEFSNSYSMFTFLSHLHLCPMWTTQRPSQPWLKPQLLSLRPTGASEAPPLWGLHVPGSFSKVKWWRIVSMALNLRTEFYPKKNKIKIEKKTEINTKKKQQKEKDFLLLWSNLLVEVLYLETK